MERRGPTEPGPLDRERVPTWAVPWDPEVELDWSQPATSRRLLREHLDQDHDGASRRLQIIDAHCRRISRLLPPQSQQLLDAACGPGLYAVRLARAGHTVTATDVGPAVLEHARRLARAEGVADRVRVERWDLATAPPAPLREAHDAVLLVYWVLEAFDARTQRTVLGHLRDTLRPGGRLLLEVRTRPEQPPGRLSHWEWVERSLLGDRPHLLLTDTAWDPRRHEYILREVAVLPEGGVRAQQTTGLLLPLDPLRRLVTGAGLDVVAVYDGWTRFRATGLSENLLLVAQRPLSRPRRGGA